MNTRQIDALLAEHLFGFKWYVHDGRRVLWLVSADEPVNMPVWDGNPAVSPFRDALREVARYSTTGDGMLAVIEAMRAKGWTLAFDAELDSGGEFAGPFFATFESAYAGPYRGVAATAPLAVALAALKALGVNAAVAQEEGSEN